MTQIWALLLALAALTVAVVAVFVVLPRKPDLDEERWLKTMLVTLLRGQVEAADGEVAQWEALVQRFVLWHPAGRLPELKLTRPATMDLPGGPVEGERALLEALAKQPVESRWARLYEEDEEARELLLADPVDLGEAYDLRRILGPGGSWEDLASWGAGEEGFVAALRRALDAHWVLVDGAPGPWPPVLAALAELLGERAHRVSWTEQDPVKALSGVLEPLCQRLDDRIVVVAAAEGAMVALRALHADVEARDHLDAFCALGGVLGGWPDRDGPYGHTVVQDWMEARFNHEELDTEATRLTPYLALQWLDRGEDPPGAGGLPLQRQRFPEAVLRPSASAFLDVVDLGPLPLDPELPVQRVAQALWTLITCAVVVRS